MNPILLIVLLVIAFFLGKASEEVEGKSKLAQRICIALFFGELLFLLFFFFSLSPISLLSMITFIIEGLAIVFLFYIGGQIVLQKRRIQELEAK